jgi:hypothetical protein
MVKKAILFLAVIFALFNVAEAGPVVCVACVTGCSAMCAATLFGAAPCMWACVPGLCGAPCLLTPV